MTVGVMERIVIHGPDGFSRGVQADVLDGLAVHRCHHDLDTWMVTHVMSGKAVSSAEERLQSKEDAYECRDEFLRASVNWAASEMDIKGEIKYNSDYLKGIRERWKSA